MSSRCLADTMAHSPYKLATRLVHFVLADIANDEHDNLLWATPKTIASKAGVSLDTVSRAINQMIKDGYLQLVMPPDHARHFAATYHFVMPSTLCNSGPQIAERPPERSANCAERSANVPPSGPQMPKPTAFTNQVKDNDTNGGAPKAAQPLPEQFIVTGAMKEWLHMNGLDHLDWRQETAQFADHHRARGSTMKDWTAAWRTWMRNAGKWQANTPLHSTAKAGYATPRPNGVMASIVNEIYGDSNGPTTTS